MNNQMVLDDKGKDNGEAVDCLAGNGIDRADTAGCNGKGWTEDGVSYTLNTIDRPAVYDPSVTMIEMTSTKNTIVENGISPTITARMGTGGNQVNAVFAYGVTSKGNGDAFITPERHTALSTGGGMPGQGYPCVMAEDPADKLGGEHKRQTVFPDKTGSLMASGYAKKRNTGSGKRNVCCRGCTSGNYASYWRV